MRQATELEPNTWETIKGAAALIRFTERAEIGRSKVISSHVGLSKESTQRGRDNAAKLRKEHNK